MVGLNCARADCKGVFWFLSFFFLFVWFWEGGGRGRVGCCK